MFVVLNVSFLGDPTLVMVGALFYWAPAPCFAGFEGLPLTSWDHLMVQNWNITGTGFQGRNAKKSAGRAWGLQFKFIPWILNIEIQLVLGVHLLMCEFPSGKGEIPTSYLSLPEDITYCWLSIQNMFHCSPPVWERFPFGPVCFMVGGSLSHPQKRIA